MNRPGAGINDLKPGDWRFIHVSRSENYVYRDAAGAEDVTHMAFPDPAGH